MPFAVLRITMAEGRRAGGPEGQRVGNRESGIRINWASPFTFPRSPCTLHASSLAPTAPCSLLPAPFNQCQLLPPRHLLDFRLAGAGGSPVLVFFGKNYLLWTGGAEEFGSACLAGVFGEPSFDIRRNTCIEFSGFGLNYIDLPRLIFPR